MRKDGVFYEEMQKFCAIAAVGPSTLRNQGAAGVISSAQKFLSKLDVNVFSVKSEGGFLSVLDDQTEKLRISLPAKAQNWGAARKALNIFLREIYYNRYLGPKHLSGVEEEWMEIPLDSVIAKSLISNIGSEKLPGWPGLSNLCKECSDRFQFYAKKISRENGISRIHLDMRLWTEARKASDSINRSRS